jgi:hypothetical protein
MSWRPFCVNEAQTASAKLETTPIQLVLATFIFFWKLIRRRKDYFTWINLIKLFGDGLQHFGFRNQ